MTTNDTATPAPIPASETPASPAAGDAPGDPRPLLMAAVALAGDTIADVRPDQFDAPTPCDDYDVRQLTRHLFGVVRRIAAAGRREDVVAVDPVPDDVPFDALAEAWAAEVAELEAAWTDPSVLGEMLTLPFATVPGAVAVVAYTSEVTVHTWDLATATGQRPDWDPAVIALSLEGSKRAIPAEPRGGPVPFGPVVAVPDDAPAIDRLVGWVGRTP
ncbi:MAG: TIGR03086 family metal-binding protein [Actinomycetota bacterium]|nr:TIGR03086 family metal-binding protein [Actinomycetota bacterium]